MSIHGEVSSSKSSAMKPLLLLASFFCFLNVASSRSHGTRWHLPLSSRLVHGKNSIPGRTMIPRGGETKVNVNDDEERYSRQVYTLGARAHGLVRSASVFIDGPSTSGLLYEAAKNLALSGIGTIVIVTSQSSLDDNYHYARWDDLGKTYIRGARAELGMDASDDTSTNEILVDYLRRLNPALQVQSITRDEFEAMENDGIFLCVDRPYDTQLAMNKICRQKGNPFIAVETAGIHGRIFSDFGPTFTVHDTDGETPAVVPLDRVELANDQDSLLLVRAVEGERHDVSYGDEIRFQLSNGEKMDVSCVVKQVQTPEKILVQVKDSEIDLQSFVDEVNSSAASFSREKLLVPVTFVTLEEATKEAPTDASLFTPCDFDKAFDEPRKNAIFHAFQSLNEFVKKNNKLPMDDGVGEFVQLLLSSQSSIETNGMTHAKLFASKCAAKFVPMQAIFGALAAQECLKAASGLYNPIGQFLLYDCDEVLDQENTGKVVPSENIDSGLAYIVGVDTTEALANKKLFVVGAGAIGCELLKNLAAMEVGTGKKGLIVLTDMDTIERSNLSRQFLFRDGDISKFKSKAAEEAVARLNPAVRIESHTNRVGETENGPFDSTFWSKKVHIVLNALDNVDARLYMDAQCVANKKALVDAGTLGSKGNVQVVVPNLSESYASSADPPDPAIPVCTLKNFPYSISHTIHWGRDLFDGLFARRPKQANQYSEVLASSGIEQLGLRLRHDLSEEAAVEAAIELSEDLASISSSLEPAEIRERAISWAIQKAHYLFHDSIVKLLEEHPIDSVDEEGLPFWSGARKPPTALMFPYSKGENDLEQKIDDNLIQFVRHGARLRIETFLGQDSNSMVSVEEARAALLAAKDDLFSDKNKSDEILEILEPLKDLNSVGSRTLNMAEFEKDDESNGHVAFITAASNLRATCYGIPPADLMETRRIAGRIVPAMITTTAFVSALSCLELLKLVQAAPLKRHRNAFINLALPFFAFTVPLPAEEVPGLRGQKYTLWDSITIRETKKPTETSGLTMRRLLKRIKKKVSEDPESIEIASISYGQYMIYANFLNDDDKEFLNKDLWTVVEEAVSSGDEFENAFSRNRDSQNAGRQTIDQAALDLTVIVEDTESGEEVELPPVKVIRAIPE